jgi:hypothetical protein
MLSFRGTFCALALAALPLSAAEPALGPRQGVVLLRNGHVIEGGITRAGDYYIVTLGQTGEIRLAAADVETTCVDVEDAYRYQAALIVGRKGAAPHVALAEWCLRQGLSAQAQEQLDLARHKEPQHADIPAIERRLKFAPPAPQRTPVRQPESAASVSAEQLEETIRELPPGTLEKFAGVAQPILLNRCAAGGCHGPTARSEFRLLRPPSGQSPSKRFTQRNLFAALQYLDKEKPDASPLLALPQGRHGTAAAPIFDKRTQHQLDDLAAFVRHAVETPAAAPPATIARASALLTQPDTETQPASSQRPRQSPAPAPAQPADESEAPAAAPRRFAPPRDAKELPRNGQFAPSDPFDPEIFNRQFRGKK